MTKHRPLRLDGQVVRHAHRFCRQKLGFCLMLLCAFVWSACSTPAFSQAQVDANSVRSAWTEYEQSLKKNNHAFVLTTRLEQQGTRTTNSLTCFTRGESYRFDETDEHGNITSFVLNSRYWFIVSRQAKSQVWNLDAYGLTPTQRHNLPDKLVKRINDLGRILTPQIGSLSLAECAHLGTFNIMSVSNPGGDANGSVEIAFSHVVPENVHPIARSGFVQSGKAVLDPAINWLPVSVDVTLTIAPRNSSAASSVNYQQRYKYETSKLPTLQSVDETTVASSYNIQRRVDITRDGNAASASQFLLREFGLDEPPDLKPRARWWVWISLAGAAFLFVSWYVRTISRNPSR